MERRDLAGRRAEALGHLRRAVEIRDPLLSAFALHSPPMATLRSAPEFREILGGLGWNPTFGPGYALVPSPNAAATMAAPPSRP